MAIFNQAVPDKPGNITISIKSHFTIKTYVFLGYFANWHYFGIFPFFCF